MPLSIVMESGRSPFGPTVAKGSAMLSLPEAGAGVELAGAVKGGALGAVVSGGSGLWVGTRAATIAAMKAIPRDAMTRL
jgi:hypothetical protein